MISLRPDNINANWDGHTLIIGARGTDILDHEQDVMLLLTEDQARELARVAGYA